MREPIIQTEEERGQVLDVERLIEAVRGSRAAQVLFQLRPWLTQGHPINDADPPKQ